MPRRALAAMLPPWRERRLTRLVAVPGRLVLRALRFVLGGHDAALDHRNACNLIEPLFLDASEKANRTPPQQMSDFESDT